MTVDAVLSIDQTTGVYDFSIGPDGDILTDDFFDTALLYAIFGERRASSNEVLEPQFRRGWIGNVHLYPDGDFQDGSKIWLLYQARLTRDNLNKLEDETRKALQYLVDDGLAISIDEISTVVSQNSVELITVVRRSANKIARRLFTVWDNTGQR